MNSGPVGLRACYVSLGGQIRAVTDAMHMLEVKRGYDGRTVEAKRCHLAQDWFMNRRTD